MIQNCDIDSKLVVAIHFSHFDPGHTALFDSSSTDVNMGPNFVKSDMNVILSNPTNVTRIFLLIR